MGEWRETVAPTYDSNGEKRRDCDYCDYFETEIIGMLSHTYDAVITPPTCTERGYTTYTCSECGDSYIGNYVDRIPHEFGEWYEFKAPSCTELGQSKRDCEHCGHVETKEIPKLAHTYEAAITAPTCTAEGYTT